MGKGIDLAGRHVLLTGGSRGLGLAMAQEFSRAGATLTLVARGQEALEKIAADVGGRALVADLADDADVDGLIQRAADLAGRPVDVLVLNAGIDMSGEFAEISAQDLRRLWQVNVLATTELIRQARPLMAASGGGHIVAVSSLSAQVAMPGLGAYAATKAAVSQFVMGVRRELRRYGITTTIVEIGQATTELYAVAREHEPTAKGFDRANRMGLLRDLSPEEVAREVVTAVRRHKPFVVLPKRARLQSVMSHAPQMIADRLLRLP
jgi:short-subunit dehydrogenase